MKPYWLCGLVIAGQLIYPGYAFPDKTDRVIHWTWFFSPDGVEIDENDAISQCTAKRPCKKLTQDFVDNLANFLTSNQLKGKLWLAGGVYDLPTNPKQNFAAMLNLHGRLSIEGRTPDFKNIANNNERPQINGTLSWENDADYKDTPSIANIRLHTEDNRIQINDTYINVNIYSAGNLEVTNSNLQKINGGNIQAIFVKLTDSTLSSKGDSAVNIMGNGGYVVSSQLYTKGFNTHNLKITKGSIAIYQSDLTTNVDACTGASNHSTAIESDSSDDLHLVSSKIIMESKTSKCSEATMTAIAANAIPYISIIDSVILLKSVAEDLVAISSNYFPIELTSSQINIQSSHGKAYAFRNYHTALEFIGKPSTIHVSSPVLAELYEAPDIINISNHSHPLSQCKLNEEQQENC